MPRASSLFPSWTLRLNNWSAQCLPTSRRLITPSAGLDTGAQTVLPQPALLPSSPTHDGARRILPDLQVLQTFYLPIVQDNIGQCRWHTPCRDAVKVSTIGVAGESSRYSATNMSFSKDAFPWVPASLRCGESEISGEEQGRRVEAGVKS